MNKFNEFREQFAKVCWEIEVLAGMAEDDAEIQEYMGSSWEKTYRPEFNVIEYLTKYYESC